MRPPTRAGAWCLSSLSLVQGLNSPSPEGYPEGQSCSLAPRDPDRGACEAVLAHPLPSAGAPRAQGPPGRSRGGPQPGTLHTDPSCLLTPPGTPLEPAAPDWPTPGGPCGKALLGGRRSGPCGPRGPTPEGETCLLSTPTPRLPGPAGTLHPQGPGGTCVLGFQHLLVKACGPGCQEGSGGRGGPGRTGGLGCRAAGPRSLLGTKSHSSHGKGGSGDLRSASER